MNLKDNHLDRLKKVNKEWRSWDALDLQRWVLWSTGKAILPDMQLKFNDIDESMSVSVNDDKHIILSVNKLLKDVTKLELTISRDSDGKLVVHTSEV
jgi:hypothetical protein